MRVVHHVSVVTAYVATVPLSSPSTDSGLFILSLSKLAVDARAARDTGIDRGEEQGKEGNGEERSCFCFDLGELKVVKQVVPRSFFLRSQRKVSLAVLSLFFYQLIFLPVESFISMRWKERTIMARQEK